MTGTAVSERHPDAIDIEFTRIGFRDFGEILIAPSLLKINSFMRNAVAIPRFV